MAEPSIKAVVEGLRTDTGLLHQIVHGDENTTVATESGVQPSLKKVVADAEATAQAQVNISTTAAAQHASNASDSEQAAGEHAGNADQSKVAAKQAETGALAAESGAGVSAGAAKGDADRALAERQLITNELSQVQALAVQVAADKAGVTSTLIGDEDYIVPAVVKLLGGYTDVVATAVSDDVWAEHAWKWGAPSKVLAVAYKGPVYPQEVALFDLTRPNLPLWISFKGSWSYANGTALVVAGGVNAPITSLALVGGCLLVGSSGTDSEESGLHVVDFADDRIQLISTRANQYMRFNGGVSQRNDTLGSTIVSDPITLVDAHVNAIAAHIADGAPHHPVSGLPMPTIAVGTDGGISVLRPEGDGWLVVNITGQAQPITCLNINDRMEIVAQFNHPDSIAVYDVPDTNIANAASKRRYYPAASTSEFYPRLMGGVVNAQSDRLFGSSKGLSVYHENPSEPRNGMVSYIAEDYATPFMVGDVDCALLCDGEEGVIVGGDLISNGGPFVDFTGWSGARGNEDLSIVDGKIRVTSTAAEAFGVVIALSGLKVGEPFKLGLTAVNIDADVLYRRASTQLDLGHNLAINIVSDIDEFIIADSETMYIGVIATTSTVGAAFELVAASFDVATPDRSGRGNHAIINGTLNRSKPAGSDIAMYSGFAASNNIAPKMPDIGTGPFYIAGLVGINLAGYRGVLDWNPGKENNTSLMRVSTTPTTLSMRIGNGAGVTMGSSYALPDPQGVYAFAMCRDDGGNLIAYVDGREIGRDSGANFDLTSSELAVIGLYWQAQQLVAAGSQALSGLIVGKGCPSSDQIRDMHRIMKMQLEKPSFLTGSVRAVSHGTVRNQDWVACSDNQVHRYDGPVIMESVTVPAEVGTINSLTVNDGDIVVGGSGGVWSSQAAKNLPFLRVIREPRTFTVQLGMGSDSLTDFYLDYGLEPVEAFKDGLLQAEGEATDSYPVKFLFDGYRWFLRFAQPTGEFRIAARVKEMKS